MRYVILKLLPVIDVVLTPFVFPAAWLLKIIRRSGIQRLPICKSVLLNVGVFPIREHYYEPQFNYKGLRQAFSRDRNLTGIDWNTSGQLDNLAALTFAHELTGVPTNEQEKHEFHFNNGSFESGDAEYWYQLIRVIKPKRIFEVGSGHSTLMAAKAICKNQAEDSRYSCKHVCIEPYEAPWLEDTGVTVFRSKIEDMELCFFSELADNDILFIDSSHMIRPRGDVLFEYLELLPSLNKGVIVHMHDIFSPRNYLEQWLLDEVKFWNEQYLLEAFLSHNSSWKILGALNYLHHNYFDELKRVAPYLEPDREPGSFYIQKTA